IDPAAAAHIHRAPAGVAGPVIIALTAPTSGTSSGTITGIDPDLLKAIIQHPEEYYVNVHNAMYPGGAARGQLSK
ncbi:MAG: CHRD domain-containing protein, partial [Ginsengibacter sp.]